MQRIGPALALFFLIGFPASADELTLEFGVTLLLKVVSYDAKFDARAPGDFVVLVPGLGEKGKAEAALRELQAVARSRLRARALVFVPVGAGELEQAVAQHKASAILALPDSTDALLAQIGRAGAQAKIYTVGFGDRAAQNGVAVAVGTGKDSKPEVLLNVAGAKAAGAEFPPSILKVARLIQ